MTPSVMLDPILELNSDARRRLDARIHEYRRALAMAPGRRVLFDVAPGLRELVTYRRLADGLPTPIDRIDVNDRVLWVKRDDLTSSLYGGNKVRKLEFLLGLPAIRGDVVVTGGGSASHHLAACAIYEHLLEITTEAIVFDQPEPNPGVAQLGELMELLDVRVHRLHDLVGYPAAFAGAALSVMLRGRRPYLMYPGASTPTGTLGYVDCGLEIAEAVHAGICPEPSTVFCALGSGGTTVGLALGLALGGLSTTVSAVRVADAIANNRLVLQMLESGTRLILALVGAPMASVVDRIRVVDGYLGPGYGFTTFEGRCTFEAARRMNLSVDQTYTAKALAAALDHVQGIDARRPVMFLDTLSAANPLI